MYVIVAIKNYTTQNLPVETSPEVLLVPEGADPICELRRMWENSLNTFLAEEVLFDDIDKVDAEACWFEDDQAVISWKNGDTQKFHLLEVKGGVANEA